MGKKPEGGLAGNGRSPGPYPEAEVSRRFPASADISNALGDSVGNTPLTDEKRGGGQAGTPARISSCYNPEETMGAGPEAAMLAEQGK